MRERESAPSGYGVSRAAAGGRAMEILIAIEIAIVLWLVLV